MLRRLIMSCAAVNLVGVLAQGPLKPIFCNSDASCPVSGCNTTTHACECQGATLWIQTSELEILCKCEPYSYSYFDVTTKLWTCPNGLQGSQSWGSCCPPLTELVNGTCTCINNLVETTGTCGCSAPMLITDNVCVCPYCTSLQSNGCEPYEYAIIVGDGFTCPMGASPMGDGLNFCMCLGDSNPVINGNVLLCKPIIGATYNATLNQYACGANQVASYVGTQEACIDME